MRAVITVLTSTGLLLTQIPLLKADQLHYVNGLTAQAKFQGPLELRYPFGSIYLERSCLAKVIIANGRLWVQTISGREYFSLPSDESFLFQFKNPELSLPTSSLQAIVFDSPLEPKEKKEEFILHFKEGYRATCKIIENVQVNLQGKRKVISPKNIEHLTFNGGISGLVLDESGKKSKLPFAFVVDKCLTCNFDDSYTVVNIPWDHIVSIEKINEDKIEVVHAKQAGILPTALLKSTKPPYFKQQLPHLEEIVFQEEAKAPSFIAAKGDVFSPVQAVAVGEDFDLNQDLNDVPEVIEKEDEIEFASLTAFLEMCGQKKSEPLMSMEKPRLLKKHRPIEHIAFNELSIQNDDQLIAVSEEMQKYLEHQKEQKEQGGFGDPIWKDPSLDTEKVDPIEDAQQKKRIEDGKKELSSPNVDPELQAPQELKPAPAVKEEKKKELKPVKPISPKPSAAPLPKPVPYVPLSPEAPKMERVDLGDDRPSFLISTHMVTNKEYQNFVNAINYKVPSHWIEGQIPKGLENEPVVNVSYRDAYLYSVWINRRLAKIEELNRAEAAGKLSDLNNGLKEWTSTPMQGKLTTNRKALYLHQKGSSNAPQEGLKADDYDRKVGFRLASD